MKNRGGNSLTIIHGTNRSHTPLSCKLSQKAGAFRLIDENGILVRLMNEEKAISSWKCFEKGVLS
jgi:hypothetical protein